MKSFNVEKGILLSKFLFEMYGEKLPYSSYKKLLRNKDIKVNNKRVNSDILLNIGDKVDVYFDGVQTKLELIYQDVNLLVFDKPSGITSENFEKEVQIKFPTAKLVHRLDRNTSGLIMFSLNETSYLELLNAFKNRSINKFYLTEVYGSFLEKEFVLTDYLLKDSETSLVKIYKENVKGSFKIITKCNVIEKYENSSLLEVQLITGKTHQIRAHLAFYGHFIIGDGKYGNNVINKKFKAKYQRLTAYKIKFSLSEGSLTYLNEKTIQLNRQPF